MFNHLSRDLSSNRRYKELISRVLIFTLFSLGIAIVSTDSAFARSTPGSVAVTPGNFSLSVSFSAVTSSIPSGATISSYQYSTDNGVTYVTRLDGGKTTSPMVITKLSTNTATTISNGTSYNIKLRALFSNSTTSSASSAVVGIPGAPTKPVISLTAVNGGINVSFAAPTSTDGSALSYSYAVSTSSTLSGASYTSVTPTGSPLVFSITGLTNGTKYYVALKATNTSGTTISSTGNTTLPTFPGTPTSLVITPTSGQLSVAFTVASGTVTTYQYSTDGGTTWIARTDSGTTASPVVITKLSTNGTTVLTNGTPYSVALKAMNNSYAGTATAPISATPATTPGAPTSIVITPGNASLSVAFAAPADPAGAAVTSYKYSTDNGSTYSTRTDGGGLTSPLVINKISSDGTTSLTNLTVYRILIKAVNRIGDGTATTSTNGTPAAQSPSAPTITGITPSSASLSVYFTAPTDNGGASITKYQYSTDNGSTWHDRDSGTTASPLVIGKTSDAYSALVNNTTYQVLLRAYNGVGVGGTASNEKDGRPVSASTAPLAPTITAITPSNAQLSVAFTSGDNGGTTIDKYSYSTDGGSTWTDTSGTSSPFTITSLVNGTQYRIQLRAHNSVGYGTATATIADASSMPATTASAPTSIVITRSNQQLSVAFTAPTNPSGASITTYQYSTDGGSSFSTRDDSGGTSSPLIITKLSSNGTSVLTNGTSYNIQIRAINRIGNGTATSSNSSAPGTTPGAPTDVKINAGNAVINVSFTAPTDPAGAAVTSYEYTTNGGTNWCTRTDGGNLSTSLTISTSSADGSTALANGTTYSVAIRAVNAIGNGTATTLVDIVPATVAAAPTNVSVTSGDGILSVSFTAPTDPSGAAVTGYEYSTDGGVTWTARTDSGGTSTSMTISYLSTDGTTPLTNGSIYTVSIRATNRISFGAQSDSQDEAPGVPNLPTSLSATAGYIQLSVSFTSPSSTGGSSITSYKYSTDNGTTWKSRTDSGTTSSPIVITKLSSADTNLTAGTTYTVMILAINSNGDGDASEAIAATPLYAALTPTFSGSSTPTSSGFTIQITNYDNAYTWAGTSSASGSVSISGTGLVTVSGLAANTASTVTVTTTRSGYVGGTATSSSITSLSAALTPTFSGSPTRTTGGFTLQVTNYSGSYTWAVTNSVNATVGIDGTGLVTVSGLAANTASTVTVTTTRSGYVGGTATSSSISSLVAALTPTFSGSPTRTADGFTIQITNYDNAYTWAGTSSASGSVSISGTGLVTVSGLAANTASTVTVTTTRSGYVGGSATSASVSSLGAARTPTFDSSVVKTNGGFTVNVTNYDSNYTFTPSVTSGTGSVSAGTPSGANLPITVTGMTAGASVTITVLTSRSGYSGGTATKTGISKANQTITFSQPSGMTVGGSTVTIAPSTDSSLSLTVTNNSTDYCTISTLTITAVSAGTCSITVSQAGSADFNSASLTRTFAIAAGATLTPTFGSITRTSSGFYVDISNYDNTYTFSYSSTSGSVTQGVLSGSTRRVTVSGVGAGQSVTLTVITTRTGYGTGTANISGAALATASLSIINVLPTSDGATFQISTVGATAGTPTAIDVTHSGQSLTVTGPSSGTYTVTGALNGDQFTLTVPWTADSGYAGSSPTTKSITVTAPPTAPTSVALVAGGSDGTLVLTWKAPTSTGGASITSYEYRTTLVSPTGWSAWKSAGMPTPSGDTYSYTITGLTNAKSYIVEVRAVNSVGSGTSASSSVSGVVAPGTAAVQLGTPGTPTATFGDQAATITFLPPVSPNDYNNITVYQYSLDATSWTNVTTTSGSGSNRVFTLSGLTNGTTYTVYVRVQNVWGNSPASNSVSVMPAKAPTMPSSIAWTVSSNSISLTFTASTSGANSVSYEYQITQTNESPDNWSGVSSVTASASPISISVTNAKKYYLRIRAKNDANLYSNYSSNQAIDTTLASSPTFSGPTSKNLTLGQSGFTLSATATPPSGQTISAYQWYKKSGGVFVSITGATSSTYSDTSTVTALIATDFVLDVTTTINGTSITTRSGIATVTVSSASPTVAVTTLAGATVGKSYSTTLSGSGGVGTYKWASSDVPSWLTLSDSGGLSGTPVTANAGLTFHVTVTDANNVASSSTVVTIVVSAALAITTKTLNIGGVNQSYSQYLLVDGGVAPYTWTLSGDDSKLPAGLELTTGGQIWKTPTKTGGTTFTVRVTDANGASTTAQYTLTVTAAVPGAPTSLSVTSTESGAVSIAWTNPTDTGGSAITNYVIEYSSGGDDGDRSNVTIAASTSRPYKLIGLTNGRTYKISVKAKNSSSTGAASNIVTVTPAGAPGKPSSVSAVQADGGISLRWKSPEDNGGFDVSSYEAQCKASDSDWLSVVMSDYSESGEDHQKKKAVTAAANSNLSNGKSYQCQIRALSSAGAGEWSDSTSLVLLATVPDKPTIASTSYSSGDGKLTVTWVTLTSDHNGGSPIIGYQATLQKQSGEHDDSNEGSRSCSTSNANDTGCVISGVAKKGSFKVYLVAINAIGNSAQSTAATVTNDGQTQTLTFTTPSGKKMGDSDFSVGATFSSGLRASYSSSTPLVCTITGERQQVHIVSSGTCTILISQTGHQDDESETDWAPYVGNGSANKVEFSINPSKPGSPSISSVGSGNQTLTLNWNAPTSGGPVTSYAIQYSTSANAPTNGSALWEPSTPLSAVSSARTANATGLSNGTAYYMRIAAVNAAGNSEWVYTSSTFTPFTVPSKSTINSVLGNVESSTATISWTATTNGGAPITGYVVTGTGSGVPAVTCTAGGSGTSCSIGGLVNKVEYSFILKAKNKAGDGSNSDPSKITLAGLSQTITVTYPDLSGWTVGDPDVQITASASSGLAITYTSTTSAICTVSSRGLAHFLTDGTCNITITQDGSGSSYDPAPAVSPVQMKVKPDVPSAPTITSVTNSISGLVIVWTAPSRKGGGSTTYNVTATPGISVAGSCQVSILTCTLGTGQISLGTLQTITVYAANSVSVGLGTASSTMTGTWKLAPEVPVADLTSGHISTADASDGKAIKIYWLKSSSGNGDLITSYYVNAVAGGETKTCTVSATTALDASGYSCSIGGLTPGTKYAVTAYARNTIGSSTGLSIGSITPGITPTIIYSGSASIPTNYGDADFTIASTVSNGSAPTYTRDAGDSTLCSINSASGLVHIIGVGTCHVRINAAANPSNGFLAASQVSVSVVISAVAPGKAIITAIATSSGQIKVTWNDPTFTGGSAITALAVATDNGVDYTCNSGTPCIINSNSSNDGHVFSVVVKETNGAALTSTSDPVSATPYQDLLAPLPVSATGGNQNIVLTWVVPVNKPSGAPITRYDIYQSTSAGGTYTSVPGSFSASTFTTTVTGVANATTLWFKIQAISVDVSSTVYSGNFNVPVSGTTNSKPTPPQSVTVTASYALAPSLVVRWSAPSNNGGSPINNFRANATAGASTKYCDAASASATTCEITGLDPATSYSVTVVATNAVGTSDPASAASPTTTFTVPNAPTVTTVTNNSDAGTYTITLAAPTDNGGSAVISYTVTAYTGASPSFSATTYTCSIAANATPLTCVIYGLTYKTAYSFAAYSTNIAGNSTASGFVGGDPLIKTQTMTFGAIANQSFKDAQLTLSATATSGLAITFTSSTPSVCTISGSIAVFTGIGSCTISVAQSGNAQYSAAPAVADQSFTVAANQPDATSLLSVAPGASQLTATWSAVSTRSQLGGSTIKSYLVSWASKSDFSDEVTATTTNTSFVITGLNPTTPYSVRVKVISNDYSDGSSWSNTLLGTPFGLPSAPASVTNTFDVSHAGSLTAGWSQVTGAATGGIPITSYTAEAYKQNSDGATYTASGFKCTSTGISCLISGLSGASIYIIKVYASNAVGDSPLTSSNTTQRPGATQIISAADVTVKHDIRSFQLDASSDSGLPLIYTTGTQTRTDPLEPRTVCIVSSTGLVTVDLAGTCTILLDQDGKNGAEITPYLPAAQKVVTITVTPTDPSVVQTLVANPSNMQIIVNWAPPADDGGRAIDQYLITWYPTDSKPSDATLTSNGISKMAEGGQLTITNLSSLATTLSSLTNGVTYTIIVQARNKAFGTTGYGVP